MANIEPFCGISIALKEQISIYINIPSSTTDATAVRPTPSSRFQRATFPAIGKVYPTKIASQSGEGRCGITACYTFLVPRTEKGCRDGQQVGECRWARTFPYVTEAEPTRSPYMRPYTRSVLRAESEKINTTGEKTAQTYKKSRPYIKAYFKNYPKKIKLTRRVRRIDAAGCRVLKGAYKKSRPYIKVYLIVFL